MQNKTKTANPPALTKIAFFDIDGVLTPSADFVPGESPKITNESLLALKKFAKQGYFLVFITARSIDELRLKSGLEELLKKEKLLDKSLLYGSFGLDEATYGVDFKIKNNKPVYKNGNAVLERKAIMKRETFGNIDHFLVYKMLLGTEIKQELKYAGFQMKPAMTEKLANDARLFFQLENNTPEERARAVIEAQKIVDKQREAFKRTNKFGSPVDLTAVDIVAGISISPAILGKHFGVLRALKKLEIKPSDKIIAYAFGDSKTDENMKIRNDIEFIRIKDNKHFVNTVNEILKN